MYGHIKAMADAEVAGLKKAGIEADVYQYDCLFSAPTLYISDRYTE